MLAMCRERSFLAGVHVGLPSVSERANALFYLYNFYLCARGKMPRVQIHIQMLLCNLRVTRGVFLGVYRCPTGQWGAGCYGTCSFKRNLCFAELALCSV